ncbi:aminoglycoside phosphotransferase family protein [Sutcliffiella horikoshii]|uniref:Aminoglycoside phosphotransferase family protein n=1 Tax=Sutcliffiella horikoshii TaxID=79883 RepID=A0A5D4SZE2_9BACI|nr:aminoglycoside phosphotransferase family protein [Sutcliffiella horikoshii]TYS67698.1 aminoglycoside phosphotransferase family protein [Sutcliffiella horikoshii]
MNESLQRKIENITGSIHKVKVLDEQGWTSEVSRISTEDGSFLLKSSYKEKYREWLREEARVLQKLNKNPVIPVPDYFGLIEEKDSDHLIMSFEEGMSLTAALNKATSLTEKKSLIRSFGRFLQQFHEQEQLECLKCDGDWLEGQLSVAQNYVENGQTGAELSLLNHLRAKKPAPVKQTMIHGDCTIDNVLVIDGEVRLFIDVAGMTVGDPRYDESLAIRKFFNNPEYLTVFYEGYTRYRVTNEEFKFFDEGLYEFF